MYFATIEDPKSFYHLSNGCEISPEPFALAGDLTKEIEVQTSSQKMLSASTSVALQLVYK